MFCYTCTLHYKNKIYIIYFSHELKINLADFILILMLIVKYTILFGYLRVFTFKNFSSFYYYFNIILYTFYI